VFCRIRRVPAFKELRLIIDFVGSIVGNFWALITAKIADKLKFRFMRAGISCPFQESKNGIEVTLPYRRGDTRKMPSGMPDVGRHGVVNLGTFLKISIAEKVDIEIHVITLMGDEPEIA
jgi:hypothetical protein